MIISIIAAYRIGDRAIGVDGHLPWHLPADMAHFRQVTMGHTLIMGRRTFDSLAGRSLPGRRIVLLSRSLALQPVGVEAVVPSLKRALAVAEHQLREDEVFIGGGGAVYQEALDSNVVDRLFLTRVEAPLDQEADTFFPELKLERWQKVSSQHNPADERNPYNMTFETWERMRTEDRSD
ncbi:MAG: dihydrofolate reductase [Anaerolineales bacterium]